MRSLLSVVFLSSGENGEASGVFDLTQALELV